MARHGLLLRALRMNAVFSGCSALALLLGGDWIALQLGLPGAAPVYLTAGVLVLFSLQLANIVRTRRIHTLEIAGIIGADIAWVVGSVVLVGLFHPSLTTAGLLLVDLVALAVLFFAIQQIRGLRALRQGANA